MSDGEGFDYIVVGSGAGGGTLSARLAEAGRSVLLLEAGGDPHRLSGTNDDQPGINRLPDDYDVPAFHGFASENDAMRWDFFVRHYASEELQAKDPKYVRDYRGKPVNGVLYPRAGTLGGCTAHNAMITVYPHNHDWDAIARMTGDPSWNSSRMREYFERLERCQYVPRPGKLPTQRIRSAILGALGSLLPRHLLHFGNPSRHGFSCWLGTQLADTTLALKDWQLVKLIQGAAADTLSTDLGRPLTLWEGLNSQFDPNDWRVTAGDPQGLWFTPLATT